MEQRTGTARTWGAAALSLVWLWFLLVPLSTSEAGWVGAACWMVLASLSIAGLHYSARSPRPLAWPAVALAGFALATLTFVIWATLTTELLDLAPRVIPKDWSAPVRVTATVLTPAPLAALLVAVLLSYPVRVLFPRLYWLIPILAGVGVVLMQYEQYFAANVEPRHVSIMLYEVACLLLLVPLLLSMLQRAPLRRLRLSTPGPSKTL